MKNKYEVLIFDADRTLFDFDKTELFGIKKVFSDIQLKFIDENFNIYKEFNHKLWSGYEKGTITQEYIIKNRFKDFFLNMNINEDYKIHSYNYLTYLSQGNYLLDDAYELISKLSEHYTLGLLTNGLTIVQNPRFNNSSIKDFFKTIIISEEVGVNKPNVEIFNIIFKELDFYNKEKILMIGDSLSSDIQGGINAGVDTCWYNPNREINTTNTFPTYEISDLLSLYNYL